jgi:hypothetical protein
VIYDNNIHISTVSNICSADIVHDLQSTASLAETPKNIAIVNHFYDSDHVAANFPTSIRSMIHQLATQSTSMSVPLSRVATQHISFARFGPILRSHNKASHPSDEEFLQLLQEMILDFDAVYLVLNSVDLCTESTELLEFIEVMGKWKDAKLHMMIIVSSDSQVMGTLGRCADVTVKLDKSSPSIEENLTKQVEVLRREHGIVVGKLFAWLLLAQRPVS